MTWKRFLYRVHYVKEINIHASGQWECIDIVISRMPSICEDVLEGFFVKLNVARSKVNELRPVLQNIIYNYDLNCAETYVPAGSTASDAGMFLVADGCYLTYECVNLMHDKQKEVIRVANLN